jgi:hypothetical protein
MGGMLRRPTLALLTITAVASAQGVDGPRCVVQSRDAALAALVAAEQTAWFVPENVERIAVERIGAGVTATLRAGDASWPLHRTNGTAAMSLAEPQCRAWRRTGWLRVEVRDGDALEAQFALRAVPERLDLPGGAAELTIAQRRRGEVPGSGGFLEVQIGDITAGQVLLEMRTARGEPVIALRSVRGGENLHFSVGTEGYVLRVTKLINFLFSDDYAVLSVASRGRFEQDRIEALLARLERAAVSFEREGESGSGAEAAAHLRRKLRAAAAGNLTVQDFIDRIGSRSSTTGKPYHVRAADGSRVEAREWLTAELEAIEREEAAAASRPASRPLRSTGQDGR